MPSGGSVLHEKVGKQEDTPLSGYAIFFSGPIGAGKTTLGRAVAVRLGAKFVDGDDYSDPGRPWYASSLGTSRRIAAEAISALAGGASVIIAYPLRRTNFVYYRRVIGDAGYRVIVVTLRARRDAILAPERGRVFDEGERIRIGEMIEQGYSDRSFSDLVVDTDVADFPQTATAIADRLGPLLVQA